MTFEFQKAVVLACVVCLLAAMPGYGKTYTAAVLRSGFPGEDADLVSMLSDELRSVDYDVAELDAAGLCDPSRLTADKIGLLVLPDSSTLPAKSAETIQAYLRAGGDIIALNTPMWRRALINVGGEWLTREEYQLKNAKTPPENVLFRFDEIRDWTRTSNEMAEKTLTETVSQGPTPGQRALHVVIPNLTSWDTFGVRGLKSPFSDGGTLTVFSARGGPETSQLAVEWDERDGSRWMAIVALTPEWRRCILTPDDFHYWLSVPTRGGRGDHFHPENAVGMSIGLAFTHTTSVGTGRHEYWVGPFGTAKMNPEYQEVMQAIDPPALDTLSPGYKLFDMHGVTKLIVRPDQIVCGFGGDLPVPRILRSPQPRPRGGGFDKGRDWRWIPLIEGRSGDGEWRGTPVTLMVNAAGPYKGSVWASFGIGDMSWYRTPGALKVFQSVAARMKIPIWLVDGGTNFYTYFEGQVVIPGVRVVNLSDEARSDVTANVTLADSDNRVMRSSPEWALDLKPGEVATAFGSWQIKSTKADPDGYRVSAFLRIKDYGDVDWVTHDINVWSPKPVKHFVTVKNGDFMLDGKRWRAHGVNYMPSSGIGTEDGEYFEHYLGRRSYDPEVVQRDLEHVKNIGLTAVSIFVYTGVEKDQNLLDILRRLDALGLKADLGLRPGTPFDFVWPQIGDIIKNSRLMENDTIFAYDIAWEPSFGHQRDRVIWDGEWQEWIVERYGSIANAEKDWDFAVPRDESGKVTNPLPEQVDTPGKWNRMVAAYRRFLDTLLYKRYGLARRLIRGVDPNHMVSFRMTETANPTYHWEGRITYDFPYLAAAVDILAPEAYGRIGDWERIKPGWFEFEWGRLCAPGLPYMWKEMGCSTWDMSRMVTSEQRLDFQATFFRDFYRLMSATGPDGIFYWWYPGGFRWGENSDFGIINPDGTDRPVTKVIRDNAREFVNGPSPKPVNYWITVDRDAHPDGVSGIYDQVKDDFWKAVDRGLTPGLRSAGTGTNSANCPLIAVGNTKCNGTNPPKYLDAAIDVVQVQDAYGKWVPVEKGGTVEVDARKPVHARIELTNLGEAKLLSPGKADRAGGVYVIATLGQKAIRTALPSDVAHLRPASVKNVMLVAAGLKKQSPVTITFEAMGRTRFGEKFTITLIPR